MAVDLDLAKLQLRVTADSEDTLIQQYADAAAATVEKRASVKLTRGEVVQRFTAFDVQLPLDWGPDPADATIAYVDTAGDDQEIEEPAIVKAWILAPSDGWPAIAENSVVEISYTAGFETVPADLVNAQLLLIQIAYERRVATADEERALGDFIFPYCRIPV